MPRKLFRFIPPAAATLAVSSVLVLGVSGTADAQSRGRPNHSGESGGGQTAAPRTAQAPAPVETRSSGSKSASDDSRRSAQAQPRGGRQPEGGRTSDAGANTPNTRPAEASDGDSKAVASNTPPESRSRDGRRSTGEAVERRRDSSGGGTAIIIANGSSGRGFYPWGYGGLGFGGYYSGGYYDPWWTEGYGQSSSYGYGYEGAVRLKVKPRDASVYVDGYFAGRVDDFDGVFQRLRIESGPHRVELRLDGHEPLSFDVRIQPNRTVTFTGELRPLP